MVHLPRTASGSAFLTVSGFKLILDVDNEIEFVNGFAIPIYISRTNPQNRIDLFIFPINLKTNKKTELKNYLFP